MVGDASGASGASDVLRAARKRAGLSQAELARRAGVVQPVISAYETGRREPGLSMLTKLVRATGHDLVVEVVERPRVRAEVPDSTMGRRLRRQRDEILALAARRGVHNVRVFGSVARGEDTEDSDVDLLVDLADDVGLVGLIGLERELSQLLDRTVDVVPARALKPGVATRALAEAISL
ncbi:MAG TPA: helix-turn-helix domain-containing protein [Acidimicrobiales bacterium]|nr:helix-turn-helix domain-containing protein [Acidimicrobiales bacterium]